MICFDDFDDDKTVDCENCNSRLCGNCVVDMIDNIDDKQLTNVIFTRDKRTFECPNVKCKGGSFNFDSFIKLLSMDNYLSMIGVVNEKISKNKEFMAIDNYKKFGDEKQLLQELPEVERLFRQWCDRFTILTPCCNRAFILRDGCMAIRCECGKNFCGLCLNFVAQKDVDSNGPCHTHVTHCSQNILFPGLYFTPEWYMSFNHKARIVIQLQDFINTLIEENKFDLLFEFCNKLQPELSQYQIKLSRSGVLKLSLTEEQKQYFKFGKQDNTEEDNNNRIQPNNEIRQEINNEPLRLSPIKRRAKRRCSLCRGNIMYILIFIV